MDHVPNILDITFMAVMAFFLIRGLVRGFVREILGLIGVVAAILLSSLTYRPLGDFLQRVIGIQGDWWHAVGFVVVLLLVFFLFAYLGHGLAKLIHAGPFSGLDRLFGSAAGLLKGALLSFILLNVLILSTPFPFTRTMAEKESFMRPYVFKVGSYFVDLVADDLYQLLRQRAGAADQAKPPPPGKTK
ncbi:MAG: CvpA family protein [Desulfarculaceae bacterium]|jgi:membrane protein required for colicin V production